MFQIEKSFENGKIKPHEEPEDSSQHSSSPSSESQSRAKDGLWNQEEVFKFISYLIFNKEALKLKLQRRTSKVFKQMSLFIKSRTSVQCRSQNQRLFRKYKNVRNIVSSFKEEYGSQRFQEEYQRIVEDPLIKFKTEYQSYVIQHVRKLCEVATQTDQIPQFSQENIQTQALFGMGYEYMLPMGGFYPNWIIVPFCS